MKKVFILLLFMFAVVAVVQVQANCTSDLMCGEDQFCDFDIGLCGYIGECSYVPNLCPDYYNPVCGCNNITYSNDCERSRSKISLLHYGECNAYRGCEHTKDCGYGEFCEYPDGQCGGTGSCVVIPEGCLAIYDPVCGCDNVTYSNDCDRRTRSVSKKYDDVCADSYTISEICDDGIDNDRDGKTDCEDYDCASDPESGCCPVGDLAKNGCPEYCTICDQTCWEAGHICFEECSDDCSSEGSKVCVDGLTAFQTCGNYDSDSCLEWSNITFCDANFTCINGECEPLKECVDSDGGKVSTVFGVTTYCSADNCTTFEDYCDGNSVVEGYCDGGLMTEIMTCPELCEGGECTVTNSCKSDDDCDIEEFCEFNTGICSGRGECRARPEYCNSIIDPVCGCDGHDYQNDCKRQLGGVSLAYEGECRYGCVDSDNGKNFFLRGTTSYCDFTGACKVYSDSCQGLILTEYYCDGYLEEIKVSCRDGCIGGACIHKTTNKSVSSSENQTQEVAQTSHKVPVTPNGSAKSEVPGQEYPESYLQTKLILILVLVSILALGFLFIYLSTKKPRKGKPWF